VCFSKQCLEDLDESMEQADIDRAFAEFDLIRPHPAPALRHAMLCVGCGSERYTFNNSGSNEAGSRVCDDCGVVQPGNVIFEQMFGRKCAKHTSNYKRIHHWHERISQLLIMESRIPPEHMVAIGTRLLDGSHAVISKDTIRGVLRSLNLQVYIEKWLQIIERCTGIYPPCPGPVILERLDHQFKEIEKPFLVTKPDSRRNFLNYNYVFSRLLQRMDCAKFCMFFPLIRSKQKLRNLDETWAKMTTLMGWPSEPLQLVAPFAVKLQSPTSLLQRLVGTTLGLAPAVPRPMPFRTVCRSSTPKFSKGPPNRERPKALQFAQPTQTLALQLKRRKRDRMASSLQSPRQ
jgi:hypothetical protein